MPPLPVAHDRLLHSKVTLFCVVSKAQCNFCDSVFRLMFRIPDCFD